MKNLEARDQRAARANLLRNPPRFRLTKSRVAAIAILAELALIHKSSRLTGATKHELFTRGAKQLSELPQ